MSNVSSRMRAVTVRGGVSGFQQQIEVGDHQLTVDQPDVLGGIDLGPTPRELLLGALGSCTSVCLRTHADRSGWPLNEVTVVVRYAEDTSAEVTQVIELLGPLTERQREALVAVANECPVYQTLQPGLVIATQLVPAVAPIRDIRADLSPSQVRDCLVGEHTVLRRLIAEAERMAAQVESGEGTLVAPLRDVGKTLAVRFRTHIAHRDELLPAIFREDPWGDVRTERLRRDRPTDMNLADSLEKLATGEQQSSDSFVSALRPVLKELAAEITLNEERHLDAKVLRDDVVAIDAESG